MPAASSPPGAGLRKVRRRRTTGRTPGERSVAKTYKSLPTAGVVGGRTRTERSTARSYRVLPASRKARRDEAVRVFKQGRPQSIKQEAIALRTLGREASTPKEWKQLQANSPTGDALPGLEKNIKKQRDRELFKSLPQPARQYLVAQSEARFAKQVFRYAKDIPNFPKAELKKLKQKAEWKQNHVQRLRLKIVDPPLGDSTFGVSGEGQNLSDLIGLDKKGNINRIGPRAGTNSLENIVGDLIPDAPWEVALTVGAASAGPAVSGVVRAGKVVKDAARATRIGKAATRVRRIRQAAVASVGSKTGATAARDAARAVATRATAKVPTVAKKTAAVTARAGTYPLRKPLKTSAVATGGSAYVQLAGGKSIKDINVSASVLSPVVRQIASVAPKGIAGNFYYDLLELPLSIVPSIYLTGDALIQAAGGNKSKLDAMVKDYIDNSFLPNAAQFLATGDPKYWVDARRSFENHPLYAALEVSGAYAVAGRGTGILLRRGAFGKRGRQIGSTERPDLRVAAGKYDRQRYSANVFTKGAQMAVETHRAKKGKNPFDVRSKADIAATFIPKVKPKRDRMLERMEVDAEAGREGARRKLRDEELTVTRDDKLISKLHLHYAIPRKVQSIFTLVMEEGIRSVETWREDLQNIRERAIAEKADLQANGRWLPDMESEHRQAIRSIDRALQKTTDAQVAEAINLKKEQVARQKKRAKELERLGEYSQNEFDRSRLMPRAIRELGARVDLEYEWFISNGRGKHKHKTFRTKEAARRFAQENMGLENPIVMAKDALVDASGKKYTLKRLRAEAKKRGWDPGFVSQSPGFADNRGNWFQPSTPQSGRPSPSRTGSRTGQATAALTYDVSDKSVIAQIAHEATYISTPNGFDRMAKDIAMRSETDGSIVRAKTKDEAQRIARNPTAYGLPADIKLTPIQIAKPGSRRSERMAARESLTADELQADGIQSRSLRDLDLETLNSMERGVGKGDWILVPEVMAKTAKDLLTNRVPEGWQQANTLFKKAVLPASPKWIIGNIVEPQIRMILAGHTPFDAVVGKFFIAALYALDPVRARAFQEKTVGGTNWAAVDLYATRGAVTDHINAWARLGKTKPIEGIKMVVGTYIAMMFKASKMAERYPQYAALGKEARLRMGEMNYTWRDALKKQGPAYEAVARGALDSAEQRAFAKAIERVHGSYLRLSANERAFFADFMPFGLWYRSAITFVGYTLPRHHPIKVAVGVGLAQMTEADRQKLGLSMTVEKRLPDYLLGSVPLNNGRILKVGSYSSFGIFAGLAQNLAGGPMPLAQVVTDSLGGVDWLGNRLVNRNGKPLGQGELFALAIANLAESSIPIAGVLHRVLFGKSFAQRIAVPPYKMDQQPMSTRLAEWAGWQTESKKDQRSKIRYRVSTPVSFPGPADVGQEKKNSGSSGESDFDKAYNKYINK